MQTATVLAAVLIVVGTLGVAHPRPAGDPVVRRRGAAVVGMHTGGGTAWSIFAGSLRRGGRWSAGTCKYLLPGRRLSDGRRAPDHPARVGTVVVPS